MEVDKIYYNKRYYQTSFAEKLANSASISLIPFILFFGLMYLATREITAAFYSLIMLYIIKIIGSLHTYRFGKVETTPIKKTEQPIYDFEFTYFDIKPYNFLISSSVLIFTAGAVFIIGIVLKTYSLFIIDAALAGIIIMIMIKRTPVKFFYDGLTIGDNFYEWSQINSFERNKNRFLITLSDNNHGFYIADSNNPLVVQNAFLEFLHRTRTY